MQAIGKWWHLRRTRRLLRMAFGKDTTEQTIRDFAEITYGN